MAKFDLSKYDTVEDRLKKFWADHPDGAVETEMIAYTDERIVIRATVYREAGNKQVPWATGIAEETRGDGFVNRTNHVENCDTSAVGRALANIGYSGTKRPSREEMEKAGQTPLTAEQKKTLIKLATEGGMDKEEATAKADAMDGRLYDAAIRQLTTAKEKANA